MVLYKKEQAMEWTGKSFPHKAALQVIAGAGKPDTPGRGRGADSVTAPNSPPGQIKKSLDMKCVCIKGIISVLTIYSLTEF